MKSQNSNTFLYRKIEYAPEHFEPYTEIHMDMNLAVMTQQRPQQPLKIYN